MIFRRFATIRSRASLAAAERWELGDRLPDPS